MMRSLFSGVSGLKAHQTGMDTIGNNIANVNTTGFKASRTTFADTLSQTLTSASAPGDTVGGTNAKQIGLGTSVASVDLIFSDGSVQSTGKNTDLCLSGNGLFVMKKGNETYYTRDGAFEFDADGNYVLPSSGLYVQGWMATDGVLTTNGGVTNITIPSGKTMAAKATSIATYANNLNSAALTITSISGGAPSGGTTTTATSASDGAMTASKNSPITLTLNTGDTVTVTSGSYTVGSSYTLKETTTGYTFTPTTTDTATVILANGDTLTGATGTAYTVGTAILDKSVTTGSQTASANNQLLITTAGGYTSGYITDGKSYTVGGDYTYTLSTAGESSTASSDSSIVVTLKNGQALNGALGSTYTVGQDYSYTVDSVSKYNDSIVTLTCADGNTYTVSSGNYSTATAAVSGYNTQYNGSDITSISVTSAAKEVAVTSAITSMDVYSPVTELDVATSVTQMTQTANTYTASTTAPVTLTMSDGSTVTQTTGSYKAGESLPVTTTLTVYDTLGNSHSIPVYFTKTKVDSTNGNQWTVSIANDGTGKVSITEDDGSVTTVSMADTTLQFDTNGKYSSGSGVATLTLTNGSTGTQTVTLSLSDLTQYAGTSTVNGSCDGNAAGTLSSVSVDSSGIITGTYTNGVKQYEAQVAIAQFTNASGLTKTGNSLYQESNNSGTANVKTAADLGCTITPSALEMSTVDIANEFSNMIVTQRGFQSNSKIITVSDEMLETLINMKR